MSNTQTPVGHEQVQQQRLLEAAVAAINALAQSVGAQFVYMDAPSRRKVMELVQYELPRQLMLATMNAADARGEY